MGTAVKLLLAACQLFSTSGNSSFPHHPLVVLKMKTYRVYIP